MSTMYSEDAIRVMHFYEEGTMPDMKHLHLFPTEFPKDQIQVVVNAFRGAPGLSKRDVIEATWYVMGYGLSMIPDEHPEMGGPDIKVLTDDEAAKYLEAGMVEGPGMKAIPWELILPILLKLLDRWLK